ncbi:hypothetical protein ACJMK2_029428 [Sinanodonta woodiana]|uniref:RING finger protein 17 n=1 Tax=Sinanodonta woodiana TaxID=1069815 RepID=A0ABD3XDZ4_SINWO
MQRCPSCPQCNSVFIAKDHGRVQRKPLLLVCGHSFCETCINQMVKTKKTSIVCPTCMKETPLLQGSDCVKNMPVDLYLMGLLVYSQKTLLEQELNKITKVSLALKKKQISGEPAVGSKFSSDKLCRECSTKQATCKCTRCDCIMCAACFNKVHSLSTSLRQHQSIPLTEDSSVEVFPLCKVHDGRPIEYYCEDDNIPICSRCVIMGDHKGHSITSMEDKNKTVINEMEPLLQVANQVHRRIKRLDKGLVNYIPDMKTETESVIADVYKRFQHLHGLLQIRETQVLEEVYSRFRNGIEPIQQLKETLQEETKELERTIKGAQRIINNNNEIIVNTKEILEKLEHAKDIPCILIPASTETSERISFESGGESLDTSILNYGSVVGAIPQRFSLQTHRQMPEEFLNDEIESLGSYTPLDSRSMVSTRTDASDDIIIEDEQEIILDETGSEKSSRKNSKQQKKKMNGREDLPQKVHVKGHNEQVYVSHIRNPCHFIVQLKREVPRLRSLSLSINNWCKGPDANKHLLKEVDVGDLVLAQYSSDKEWYRARVRQVVSLADDISQTQVEVAYIDYGNTEVITVTSLRNMQVKFMKHPEFAFECGLSGIVASDKGGAWSLEAVQTFAKMVENRPMLMSVISELNNILQVDLSKPPYDDITDDTPVSVRDALVFLELARFESPASVPVPGGAPAPKRNFLAPDLRCKGEVFNVVVTCAGDPDNFYVQELGENSQYLETMMRLMHDTYTNDKRDSLKILCPQIGMICVTQNPADNMWYRARIIGLPGDKMVDVYFVDYGNLETVPYQNLRKLTDQFLVLPCQATKCGLADVENLTGGSWTEEALRDWSDMAMMKRFSLRVLDSCDPLKVVLHDPGDDPRYSVNGKMVAAGHAMSTGKWSLGVPAAEIQRRTTVTYEMEQPYIGSPKQPLVVLNSGNSQRNVSLASNTNFSEESSGETPPLSPKFHRRTTRSSPGDSVLKPVVLLPVHSPHSSLSPDSSEKEIFKTPPLSPLPTQQPVKPASSQHTVSTSSSEPPPRPASSFQIGASKDPEKKSKCTRSSMTITTAASKKEAESLSRKESLVAPKKEKPNHQVEVEVKISEFVSPSDFHVQLASSGRDGLDDLMESLKEACDKSGPTLTTWEKDGYCAARYSVDGKWYRAKITKVMHKNLMEVFMVDYGFTDNICSSSLRPLTKILKAPRCFAFRCHLADLVPAGDSKKWSRTACEYMMEVMKGKKVYIAKKGDIEDNSLPIDLILEEDIPETALEPASKNFHSLIDVMKEKGLGFSVRKGSKKQEKPGPRIFPVLQYTAVSDAPAQSSFRMIPMYVDYTAVIYFQKVDNGTEFENLHAFLQKKFKDSDPHHSSQPWKEGQACVALFRVDNVWCRATILTIEPHRVKVQYIDYGNSEWVSLDRLRADVEDIVHIPRQCFECILHDIFPLMKDGTWPVPVLDYMHKQLVNKTCFAKIVERPVDKPMAVNLSLNGNDFGTQLVQLGMAQREIYLTDQKTLSLRISSELQNSKAFKTMELYPVGKRFPVCVTHVELPDTVYFQHEKQLSVQDLSEEEIQKVEKIKGYLEKLEQLARDLNQKAHTFPALPIPSTGLACCAQFSFDQCWYRALIVDKDDSAGQVLVLYVDYGNSELVSLDRLRCLPPKYMSLPAQAVRCKLHDISPPVGMLSWRKEALQVVAQCISQKPIFACIRSHKPVSVDLYEVLDQNVTRLAYQPALDQGLIQHTEESSLYDDTLIGSHLASEGCSLMTTDMDSQCSKSWAEIMEEGDQIGKTEINTDDSDVLFESSEVIEPSPGVDTTIDDNPEENFD